MVTIKQLINSQEYIQITILLLSLLLLLLLLLLHMRQYETFTSDADRYLLIEWIRQNW